MVSAKRKGIAIVETKEGILVVAGDNKRFMLPGGGVEFLETRKKAAVRELYEETGLTATSVKYLFKDVGKPWMDNKGRLIKSHSKVFLIEAEGEPRPGYEIRHIAYWDPDFHMYLSKDSRRILERYLKEFKKSGPEGI